MNFRAAITALFMLAAISHGVQAQDIEAGKKKAEACVACHGAGGNSVVGAFPTLAGQNARYIYLQLRDYKEGRRKNPMMSPVAAGLEKQDKSKRAPRSRPNQSASRPAQQRQKNHSVRCAIWAAWQVRTKSLVWRVSIRSTSSRS